MSKMHEAEARGIWHHDAGNRYLFDHALLRQAVYDMQFLGDLRLTHRKAASAIEELYAQNLSPYYDFLAYHYRYAEDQNQEWHYAVLAGQYAAQDYRNQAAQEHFSRALKLTPETEYRKLFSLLLDREQVNDRLGRRDEQAADLDALEALTTHLNDPHASVQVALRQSGYAGVVGEFEMGISNAKFAIELALNNNSEEERVNGYLALAKNLLAQGELVDAQQYFQQALDIAEAANFWHLLPECLRGLGDTAIVLSPSFDDALAYFNRALQICDEIEDIAQKNHTHLALGIAAFRKGEYVPAKQHFEIAQAGFSRMNDRRNRARALTNEGIIMNMMNRRPESLEYLYRALTIVQEVNDRLTEARLYLNIGIIKQYQGDYKDSVKESERALVIAKDIGNKHVEAQLQINLGLVRRYQGIYTKNVEAKSNEEISSAKAHYNRAQEIYLELIEDQHEDTIFGFAMVASDMGDYEAAHSGYKVAIERYQQSGDKNGEGDVCACLALLLSAEGKFDEAIPYGEQALAITLELEEETMEAFAHNALADVFFGKGDYERAAAHYQNSARLHQKLDEKHLEAEARAGLAHIAFMQGDEAQMREQIDHVVHHWEAIGNFDGAVEPIRTYMICYQVLAALGDIRAQPLLEAGWETLNQRTETIVNDNLRQLYQTRVVTHSKFIEIYQQFHGR